MLEFAIVFRRMYYAVQPKYYRLMRDSLLQTQVVFAFDCLPIKDLGI